MSRGSLPVVAGAAKQQATVGGEAVVVKRHVLIAHRHVLRQQALAQAAIQHLGGKNVGAGRQHPPSQLRIEVVEVGVAADHQIIGGDPPMSRGHLDLLAVIDMGHSGVFKQGNPEAGGGTCLAERQIEGMEMAGAHVDKATDIAIRPHHGMDIFARHQLEFVLIAEARQMVELLLKTCQMALTGGQIAVTPGEIAVDIETLHPLAHQLHRLQPHQVELAHPLLTNPAGKLVGVVADTANKLTAVAPRRPQPMRLASSSTTL